MKSGARAVAHIAVPGWDHRRMARTSGMLALIPDDPSALAVDGGLTPDDLHLTLLYLGDDVGTWDEERRDRLRELVLASAPALDPVDARIFGHALFNPDSGPDGDRDPTAVYLVGDSAELGPMRDWARWALGHEDYPDLPEQHEPHIFHVSVIEGDDPSALSFTGDVRFGTLRLALGDEVTDAVLGREPGEGPEPAPDVKGLTFTPPRGVRDAAATLGGATAARVVEGKALTGAEVAWVAAHCGEPGQRWAADMQRRGEAVVETKRGTGPDDDDGWGELLDDDKPKHEVKVMSPSPGAAKLRHYWAKTSKGRAKWRPGTPGDFKRLRRRLAKYVKNPRVLNGLTANIHKLGTGKWPGPGKGPGRHKTVAWDEIEVKTSDLEWADEDDLATGVDDWGPEFVDEDLSGYGPEDFTDDDLGEDDGEEIKEVDRDLLETSRLAAAGSRFADDEEESESYEETVAADDVWQLDADGAMVRTSGGEESEEDEPISLFGPEVWRR